MIRPVFPLSLPTTKCTTMPHAQLQKMKSVCSVLLTICALLSSVPAQQSQQPQTAPPAQGEDVVRINTDVVQTDVMVFDHQGHFVDNLTRDQFELKVDGKPQSFSFFERIQAGTVNEEAQLAAARGIGRSASSRPASVRPLDRGRTIYFFVDDLHLSPSSAATARKTLTHFINDELGQNDEAAVTSASGQIGFLQQVTGERVVLRAAVERVNSRSINLRDMEHPPMNEHQALAIDRNQREILDYFIEQILRENPFLTRSTAENMVTTRAHHIIEQSTAITRNTLTSLENLVRKSADIPGRKLVLFISDGFFIEDTSSIISEQLRRITDAAARSSVVIYTMDARGLTTNSTQDPSQQQAYDPSGRLQRLAGSEIAATQDIFQNLAADTGGRAMLNSNSPERLLTKALQDSSIYYLLAWQPERGDQRNPRFRRIEVKLPNHPDFNVIVRRGFYDSAPEEPARTNNARNGRPQPSPSPDNVLMELLRSASRRTALPTALTVAYADVPQAGLMLSAGLQIDGAALDFQSAEGNLKAAADIVCAVYDDQGKFIDGFKHQIAITAHSTIAPTERTPVIYVHQFKITPGLYQIRSATRDARSGRLGSAVQWIEIPDLTQGKLSLSSIFIAERSASQEAGAMSQTPQDIISTNADHLFPRASSLRFLVFVYNAKRSDASPDVAIQVQIFRDDQPVVTDTLRKISVDSGTDLARMPYAADIPLQNLPAGRYVLQLTAIDRVARTSASQRVNFDIE
ncbi:MAG TPA: VWA domain-containing protein [Pyrinomonadaceae bacterium]|nr:VWA domain-containing protein [Pyrinomonadaceae bacterium]